MHPADKDEKKFHAGDNLEKSLFVSEQQLTKEDIETIKKYIENIKKENKR